MLGRNLLALASATALAVGVGGVAGNWWWSAIVAGLVGALAVYMGYRHDVTEVVIEEGAELGDEDAVDELGEQRARRELG